MQKIPPRLLTANATLFVSADVQAFAVDLI